MIRDAAIFLLLLRPKALSLLRGASGRGWQRWRALLLLLLGLGTAVGIEVFSAWFLRHCLQVELVGALIPRRLMSLVLAVLLAVLLVSATITSFTTFFLSADLPLLVWSPTPAGPLFFARLVEMLVHSSWMVLFFGLPVFIAYGRVYQAAADYYLVLGLVLPLLVLMAGSLGALAALLLTRVISARRSRDLLLVLSFLAFAGLYLLLRLLRPERMLDEDSFGTMMEFLGMLQAPESPWLPTRWTVDLLFSLLRRQGLPLVEMAALVFTAGGMLAIAGWLGSWLYWPTHARTLQGRVQRRGSGRLLGSWLERALSGFGLAGTLLVKDARIFLRDPSQWTQLVLLAALAAVYLLNFVYLRTAKLGWFVLYTTNHVLMGLVVAGVAVRFVFPAVSLEGRAWWLVRVAPLEMGQFLHSKLLNHLLPLSVLLGGMAVVSAAVIDVPAVFTVISLALVLVMTLGVCTLAVGLGAWRPRFTAENPAKIPTGIGGVAYMLSSLAYVFLLLAASVYPTFVLYRLPERPSHPIGRPEWFYLSLAFMLVLAITVAFLPMRWGRKALEKYEWP